MRGTLHASGRYTYTQTNHRFCVGGLQCMMLGPTLKPEKVWPRRTPRSLPAEHGPLERVSRCYSDHHFKGCLVTDDGGKHTNQINATPYSQVRDRIDKPTTCVAREQAPQSRA